MRGGAYLELDGGRTERKIADHLFPETRLVGRTWRTLTVVAEPYARVPAAAASSVVQPNFAITAGHRADSCRPSRPAVVAIAAVHVPPRLQPENLVTDGPGQRRVSGCPRSWVPEMNGSWALSRVASRSRIPSERYAPHTRTRSDYTCSFDPNENGIVPPPSC